jgi:hypothetical protein
MKNIINVMNYGVVGDGVTNDTVAIQSAIDYASNNNLGIYFPSGRYLYNTIHTKNCKYIEGDGESTKMISNYTQGLVIDSDDTQINNMFFCRENTSIKQYAVVINKKYRCKIINCRFNKIGIGDVGAGVYIKDIGTSQHGQDDGCLISNCYFTQCYHGIEVGNNGVYVTINGCNFNKHCGWAIWSETGNVLIDGCSIVKCDNGIYLGNDGNGGHSSITACNINHIFTDNNGVYTSGYALYFKNIILSEIISSCAIYDAKIYWEECSGILVTNCTLAIVDFEFINTINSSINNNIFYKAYGHTISKNTNSFVEWWNNKVYDKTVSAGHNELSEEGKGHRFIGTTLGQTIEDSANSVLAITGEVKISNCTNYTLWKDAVYICADNRIVNQGQGGNRIKVNVSFVATIPTVVSGAKNNILAYLNYGTKRVYFSICALENDKTFYFSLLGEIAMEYGDEIQILVQNKTGQPLTILTNPSVVEFEGM